MKIFGSNAKGKFSGGVADDPSGSPEVENEEAAAWENTEASEKILREAPTVGDESYNDNDYEAYNENYSERYDEQPSDRSGGNELVPEELDYSMIYKKNGKRRKSKKKKRKQWLIAISAIVVCIVSMYLFVVYTQFPPIKLLRDTYIETAMRTGSHHYLAEMVFPKSVIEKVMTHYYESLGQALGVQSTDAPTETPTEPPVQVTTVPEETLDPAEQEKLDFYELFWELDEDSMETYLAQNPDVIADGYSQIKVNEAGLYDSGIDVYTTMGEQVLAIDAKNQILLVRAKGDTFRGVLAVVKDPSMLHCYPSQNIGTRGENAGSIATRNGGILAITGSGFDDPSGNGNGGRIAGMCICDGVTYGDKHRGWGSKRIELRENDRLYIVDAQSDFTEGTTDAVEFEPAMIINGEDMGSGNYYELNPRACIGQSDKNEVLLVATEGRFWDSMGCSVSEISKILFKHNCVTAMNLDGGTSAIMWYEGEPVIRCSNTSIPQGRSLPNAWVIVPNND